MSDTTSTTEVKRGEYRTGALADLIQELCVNTYRAILCLHEADSEEFEEASERVATFKHLVSQLPTAAKKRRTVGFRVEVTPKRRRNTETNQ